MEKKPKKAKAPPAKGLVAKDVQAAVGTTYRGYCYTDKCWTSDEWTTAQQAAIDAQPHIDANHNVEIKEKLSGAV